MDSTISEYHGKIAAVNISNGDRHFYISGSYGVVTSSPVLYPGNSRPIYIASILPAGGNFVATGRFESTPPHGSQRAQRPALYKNKKLW